MERIPILDLEISRLTLGTVQFGLDYGIANRSGQPSYGIARDIIACACEGGVNCLDTGSDYGVSEEVIGRALSELGLSEDILVATKVSPMPPELSVSEADRWVEKSLTTSLERLRLSQIPICLFHREKNFRYVESLARLKDKGLVRHIGCSVMTPEAGAHIVRDSAAEAVQIPASVLDRRFSTAGVLSSARATGTALFIRSVYLQGLVFLRAEEVLPELIEVVPVLTELRRISQQAGLDMPEMAMRYVLGLDGLTSVVAGVETVQQMRRNIALVSKGPLDPSFVQEIEEAVPELSDAVLMPNRWSKRMPDAG